MTREEMIIQNAFKLPGKARSLEAVIGERMRDMSGRPALPPTRSQGDHTLRMRKAEARKQVILSKLTRRWRATAEVAKETPYSPAGLRSAIQVMVNDGRVRCKKRNGKLYVRLPQEEAK